VARIAPKNAPSASGLVTYDVYLTLEESDLPLRASMTANADLVTADRNGVLLVPNEAISVDRQTNTYTVNRMAADGTTERVEVNIGLRDGRFTEVVSGVDEGDELMVGQLINRPNFGPPGS
jgi:multidrug efflux pump subunit AcrA (membrane-fusion protein)